MLANREWAQYAIKRASLRVTLPSAGQRSTYFLQLPYTFSVPLLIASTLLHWLVSQSIFLARIAVYRDGELVTIERIGAYNNIPKNNMGVLSAVGYSDSALLTSIGWGSALVVFCLLVAGICTYPKGLPVGGTNSAVISATCHVKYGMDEAGKSEVDIANQQLKWGVTIPGSRNVVGHCCFSSSEVEGPKKGYLYAGVMAKTRSM
jgi:hypothetical protein